MKKLLALILALTMCLCLFSACSNDKDAAEDAEQTVTEETQTGDEAATEDETVTEEPVDIDKITPATVESTLELCHKYHDTCLQLIAEGKDKNVEFYPELLDKVEYQTMVLKDYENIVITDQHESYTTEELEAFNAKLKTSLETLIGAQDELQKFINEAESK